MTLAAGMRLGPYELQTPLGSGGMGEVYQARDSRLNREVALKVLPAHLMVNPDRRRRFVQEAQLASSLQHPNIVTIFDIGSAEGADFLAMELVHGRTLDAVIPRGGLRASEAVRYSIAITDALAAAHAAGIVHRDLKPANLMVTDQGQIKVLDFGLATLTERGLTSASDETRPQADVVETGAGTVLGTVAYMSPEQAEGKTVDARSDLFSFGAILYEMLSGQRAFRADTAAATLAAVINLEPKPLATVVEGVPHALERLVSRCLRKDLGRRAQHAVDLKIALEELRDDLTSGSLQAGPVVSRSRRPWMVPLAAGLVTIAVAGAAAVLWPRTTTAPASFEPVPLTSLPGSEQSPSLNPDGSQIAFAWSREGSLGTDVWVKVTSAAGAPAQITRDDASHGRPSWSPDGKSIALWHVSSGNVGLGEGTLVIVSPLGGPEQQVLQWNGGLGHISWSPDSKWVAVSQAVVDGNARVNTSQGIVLVSVSTREPVDWAKLNPIFRNAAYPAFSADGRLAYVRETGGVSTELYTVRVGTDGRPSGEPTLVTSSRLGLRQPQWRPDGRELVAMLGSGLARIRADRTGEPERIEGLSGVSTFALSRDGRKLAFSTGSNDHDIWRLDLQAREKSGLIAHSTYGEQFADYSPDGLKIVFGSTRTGSLEIWVADASGDNAQPLTSFGGPLTGSAQWSPDSKRIAFDSRPDGNSDIFLVPAVGGRPVQLTTDPSDDARPTWSKDGQWIYFSSDRGGQSDIWRMPAAGGEATRVTRRGGFSAIASPDDQWLYYARPSERAIYRIRPDGTGDAVVIEDGVAQVSFATTPDGDLWFISPAQADRPYWSLRVNRLAGGPVQEVARLDVCPCAGVSVSRDGRYVLVGKLDQRGTNLMLVESFR
jgi:serine/threonine protein kinase/dipeptidyl aminopeptidase/acylaminoacyl peptidase